MDKKLLGALSALSAFAAMTSAQAAPAPSEIMRAQSFDELLDPIANAASLLQALDETRAKAAEVDGVKLAYYHHHHHHHHHHRYYHHHHHHQYHHHHHHHHRY